MQHGTNKLPESSFENTQQDRSATERTHVASQDNEKGPAENSAANVVSSEVIVNWDGDNDPEYPMNWTNIRKFKNVSVICYCTFLT